MRQELLSDERKKDIAQRYLDRSIELLAERSKHIPLDKARRVEYILGEYDLDSLMLQFRQAWEEYSKGPKNKAIFFFFGWAIEGAFEFLTDLDIRGTSKEEKRQIVEGMVLVSLWSKAK